MNNTKISGRTAWCWPWKQLTIEPLSSDIWKQLLLLEQTWKHIPFELLCTYLNGMWQVGERFIDSCLGYCCRLTASVGFQMGFESYRTNWTLESFPGIAIPKVTSLISEGFKLHAEQLLCALAEAQREKCFEEKKWLLISLWTPKSFCKQKCTLV